MSDIGVDGLWLAVGLGALSYLKAILLDVVRRGRSPRARPGGWVSGIRLYPLKSGRALELDEARVTHTGLVDPRTGLRDRSFMVVDESGNFVSQRKDPTLALVTPSIHGDNIHFDAPGLDTLIIPLHPALTAKTEVFTCRVWGDELEGASVGPEADKWVTSLLGRKVSLVYAAPGLRDRDVSRKYIHLCRPYDKVAFQDWGQLLALSEASVQQLNERLEHAVTLRHFRPNIIISGCPAHDEDVWHKVYLDTASFTNIKLCGRCVMTTVDPDRGVKDPERQPLETLKTYRMKPGFSDPCFGVNLFCDKEGTVRVGQSVVVTDKEGAARGWF